VGATHSAPLFGLLLAGSVERVRECEALLHGRLAEAAQCSAPIALEAVPGDSEAVTTASLQQQQCIDAAAAVPLGSAVVRHAPGVAGAIVLAALVSSNAAKAVAAFAT